MYKYDSKASIYNIKESYYICLVIASVHTSSGLLFIILSVVPVPPTKIRKTAKNKTKRRTKDWIVRDCRRLPNKKK